MKLYNKEKSKKQLFSLIKNEVTKVFTMKYSLIMFTIILLVVIAYSISFKSTTNPVVEGVNWKESLSMEVEKINENLNNPYIGKSSNAEQMFLSQIKVYTYMIDNNIKPIKKLSVANFLLNINNLFSLVIILVIISTGKIVADEYRYNTINNLLTMPCKKWKVIVSKYITIFLISLITIFFIYFFSIIVGWISFGFDALNEKIVTCVNEEIVVHNIIVQSLLYNIYNLVVLLACTSMTFLICILSKNGMVSTCISIIFYYAGTRIAIAFSKFDILKYALFSNVNFQTYYNGVTIYEGTSPKFSVIVVLVHVLCFVAITLFSFYRKKA